MRPWVTRSGGFCFTSRFVPGISAGFGRPSDRTRAWPASLALVSGSRGEVTVRELAWEERISIYRELSKSGIVALVVISVLGGYLAGQSFETRLSLLKLVLTLL